MKFCQTCGSEIHDEDVICPKCGCSVSNNEVVAKNENDGLAIAIKIFLVIGCIAQGWMILPLAWCLPITISIFKKLKNGQPIGVGLKICSLLFVNTIAGILALCRSDA